MSTVEMLSAELPHILTPLPGPRARAVIECEGGAFAAWAVHVGDQLELR